MDLAGKINLFYQPILTEDEREAITEGDYESIRPNFTNSSLASQRLPGFGTSWFPRSERVCIDRLEMIVKSLPEGVKNYSFADYGCSNGFFINCLSFLGAKPSLGIDNSIHNDALKFNKKNVIEKAREDASETYDLAPAPTFIDANFITWLEENPNEKHDVSIFVSVLHHFFKGYGNLNSSDRKGHDRKDDLCNLGEEAHNVLKLIDRATNKYLVFEMDEEYVPGWNKQTIPDLMRVHTSFKKHKVIGVSDGFTPRTVFLFEK